MSASVSPSVGSMSAVLYPNSFWALCRPAYAASLKDWSPLPPMSYAMARPLASLLPSSPLSLSLLVPPQAVAASASDATPTATRVSLDIRRI